ncbi:MAG: alpha/beta fold hydrolase [Acidimicrobiales bacterium]
MTADDGHRLHAVVHEGRGPYALLVHGALGSRSYWADNVGALAAVCRPVVVELWGHGRSPTPTDPDRYGPESYFAEFERLRERLAVAHWFTIGQSLGAGLTLNYGLAHPERVLAQVVTNSTSAFASPERWAENRAAARPGFLDSLRSQGMDAVRDSPVNPGRSRRISEPTRALLACEFDEHDPEGVARGMEVTGDRLPLGPRLAEVSRPTLLTVGVQEERFAPMVPRARRIPGIEVAELEASHAVNAHEPAKWNAVVVDFLRRHGGGGDRARPEVR